MKLLLLFTGFVLFIQLDARERLLVHSKQRRWLADDLQAFHQKKRKTHEDYVPDYPDAPILTVLTVGTPARYFFVSMESGSEATFLLAEDYPGRNVTGKQPFFDPARSSTARAAGGYHAFSGELEVFGEAYDDVVGLFGFGGGMNATQRFGVVNDVLDPWSFFPHLPDGVVGLSWDPEDAANPSENSSAIVNLFAEFGDLPRFYCDWTETFTDPQYGRDYDALTEFGACLEGPCEAATPENTYPLVWLEETRALAFWVDSFTYNGQQFAGGYGKVDTGVPNILVPYDPLVALIDDVQPTFDWEYGVYVVDCSLAGSLRDWTFTIGGNSYAISSTAYVVDLLLPNGQCAFSVHSTDGETTDYVFGYVFHNLWCIKMDIDQQAISLMPAQPAPTRPPH